MSISILILTRNEEQDLPGCLQSVAWSDDIVVFDSLSTDRTTAIAEQAGARVVQRAFDNYAAQRNAALHEVSFKHPWVLQLDSDERVPERLRDELQHWAAKPPEACAGRLRRRDFFMDTWLKHAQISPYYVRLVRPEKVHYERDVNEVLKVDGPIVDLREPFDHHPFSKGIAHWFDKHNRYSSMEAALVLQSRRGHVPASLRTALFGRDFNERRFHQKEFFYRLPFRPLVKWLYMMFVRGAILDGRAGVTYAFLQAIYEYMIVLKTAELERREKEAPSKAHAAPAATEAVR